MSSLVEPSWNLKALQSHAYPHNSQSNPAFIHIDSRRIDMTGSQPPKNESNCQKTSSKHDSTNPDTEQKSKAFVAESSISGHSSHFHRKAGHINHVRRHLFRLIYAIGGGSRYAPLSFAVVSVHHLILEKFLWSYVANVKRHL